MGLKIINNLNNVLGGYRPSFLGIVRVILIFRILSHLDPNHERQLHYSGRI